MKLNLSNTHSPGQVRRHTLSGESEPRPRRASAIIKKIRRKITPSQAGKDKTSSSGSPGARRRAGEEAELEVECEGASSSSPRVGKRVASGDGGGGGAADKEEPYPPRPEGFVCDGDSCALSKPKVGGDGERQAAAAAAEEVEGEKREKKEGQPVPMKDRQQSHPSATDGNRPATDADGDASEGTTGGFQVCAVSEPIREEEEEDEEEKEEGREGEEAIDLSEINVDLSSSQQPCDPERRMSPIDWEALGSEIFSSLTEASSMSSRTDTPTSEVELERGRGEALTTTGSTDDQLTGALTDWSHFGEQSRVSGGCIERLGTMLYILCVGV